MESSIYFTPSEQFGGTRPEWSANTIGDSCLFHGSKGMPDLEGVKVAILGVIDDPGHAKPRGCVDAPDAVREQLYQLHMPANPFGIADLGDLHPGATLQDTQHALAETLAELIRHEYRTHHSWAADRAHTYTQYLAYERLERTANLVPVSTSKFDLGEPGQGLAESSYLSHIVLRQPNFLFNYSNLGYQTYLVDQPGVELMDKFFFDAHRLGELRSSNLADAEPVLRNADTLSVDMSCHPP
jgi:formiminoglutamase